MEHPFRSRVIICRTATAFLDLTRPSVVFSGGWGPGCWPECLLGIPWWLGLGAGLLSYGRGPHLKLHQATDLGLSSGEIVPILDQGFEGLFPFLLLAPYFSLSAGDILLLLVLFSLGAFVGSLFLNRVLLATPFANYPRLLRPRVRLKEFRACQITSGPLRYFLNFEDAFYYHVLMRTTLRLMGVYEKGKRNALQLKTTNIAFYFSNLPTAFENYTILFLSDLHLDGLDGLTEKAPGSGEKAPRGPLYPRWRSQDGASRTL